MLRRALAAGRAHRLAERLEVEVALVRVRVEHRGLVERLAFLRGFERLIRGRRLLLRVLRIALALGALRHVDVPDRHLGALLLAAQGFHGLWALLVNRAQQHAP